MTHSGLIWMQAGVLPTMNYGVVLNAGAVLAEIWRNLTFDGYPVVAEYVTPKQGRLKPEQLIKRDAAWISRHVAASQHFLQIVKCNNVACCGWSFKAAMTPNQGISNCIYSVK